ncbi:flagellar hook-length control protein FliK [Lysobacter sp. H21R4]|uniref:flagellar hook-length control protein FliK n=1 Tax=Lysobacter sp. H21R4 TaxID=2781021 RepID=UPI001889983A|nr:flagellar hook-length control protein FliK [Lysobacter sp. H21R4]QOY63333.1 flagellar hook-length control protein FliK [Lysobacter sp. H21R4]
MMAGGVGGGGPAGRAPVRPATSEANASQQRPPGGDPQGTFAGLLAGSGSTSATAQSAATGGGGDSSSKPGSRDDDPTDEDLAEDLPEQILNLLGGNAWPPIPPPAGGDVDEAGGAGDLLSTAGNIDATQTGNRVAATLPGAGAPAPAPLGNGAFASPATAAGALPVPTIGTVDGADAAGDISTGAGAAMPLVAAAAGSSESETVDPVEFVLPGQASVITGPGQKATTPLPGAPIPMPTDPDAGFDDGFGARIGWMAEQRLGHAQLRISPDHLGPIDVRLQLDGTRVTAEFASASAEVRQALEASVGRLRDLLDQHGLQLAQADVGGGQGGNSGKSSAAAAADDVGATDGTPIRGAVSAPTPLRRGLLDEYA